MGQPNLCCLIMHIVDDFRAIGDRLGIWHGNDRGISPMCCCPRSGLNVFFCGKSRVAQMHMQIDKSRKNIAAAGVDHLIVLSCRQILLHLCHAVSFHIKIHDLIRSCRWI